MDTSEKDANPSMPQLTPKNQSGSQRVIKKIMVIDPNKLRVAGLDVKMAEALKKTKPKSAGRLKEDKLAKYKLNKKLKDALMKATEKSPAMKSTTPSNVHPMEELARKLSARKITKSGTTEPKLNVTTLKSLMPPPPSPVSSPVASNQTMEFKVLKPEKTRQTIEIKIIGPSKEVPKEIDQFPKASLKAFEPQKPKKITEKNFLGSSPKFQISTTKLPKGSPAQISGAPSSKEKDTSISSKEHVTLETNSLPVNRKSLQKQLEPPPDNTPETVETVPLPIEAELCADKVSPMQEQSLILETDSSIETTCLVPVHEEILPSTNTTSTPIRRESLPTVIESIVLLPEDQIDLSTLTKKSLIVPKKRYKLEQNWISIEPNAEPLHINLSPVPKATTPTQPAEEESAVDFINNLSLFFAESQKTKTKSNSVPELLTEECSEDATSFLMSLFDKKLEESTSIQTSTLETQEVNESRTLPTSDGNSQPKMQEPASLKTNDSEDSSLNKTSQQGNDLLSPKQDSNIKVPLNSPNSQVVDILIVNSPQESFNKPLIELPFVEALRSLDSSADSNNIEDSKPQTSNPKNYLRKSCSSKNEKKQEDSTSLVADLLQESAPKSSAPPVNSRRKCNKPMPVLKAKLRKSRNAPLPPQKSSEGAKEGLVPENKAEKSVEESPTQPVQKENSFNNETKSTNPVSSKPKKNQTPISGIFEETPVIPEESPTTSKSARPQRHRKISLKLLESSESLPTVMGLNQPIEKVVNKKIDLETAKETSDLITTVKLKDPIAELQAFHETVEKFELAVRSVKPTQIPNTSMNSLEDTSGTDIRNLSAASSSSYEPGPVSSESSYKIPHQNLEQTEGKENITEKVYKPARRRKDSLKSRKFVGEDISIVTFEALDKTDPTPKETKKVHSRKFRKQKETPAADKFQIKETLEEACGKTQHLTVISPVQTDETVDQYLTSQKLLLKTDPSNISSDIEHLPQTSEILGAFEALRPDHAIDLPSNSKEEPYSQILISEKPSGSTRTKTSKKISQSTAAAKESSELVDRNKSDELNASQTESIADSGIQRRSRGRFTKVQKASQKEEVTDNDSKSTEPTNLVCQNPSLGESWETLFSGDEQSSTSDVNSFKSPRKKRRKSRLNSRRKVRALKRNSKEEINEVPKNVAAIEEIIEKVEEVHKVNDETITSTVIEEKLDSKEEITPKIAKRRGRLPRDFKNDESIKMTRDSHRNSETDDLSTKKEIDIEEANAKQVVTTIQSRDTRSDASSDSLNESKTRRNRKSSIKIIEHNSYRDSENTLCSEPEINPNEQKKSEVTSSSIISETYNESQTTEGQSTSRDDSFDDIKTKRGIEIEHEISPEPREIESVIKDSSIFKDDLFGELKSTESPSKMNESEQDKHLLGTNKITKTIPQLDDLIMDIDHIESPSFSPIGDGSRISDDSDGFEEIDADVTSAIIETVKAVENSQIIKLNESPLLQSSVLEKISESAADSRPDKILEISSTVPDKDSPEDLKTTEEPKSDEVRQSSSLRTYRKKSLKTRTSTEKTNSEEDTRKSALHSIVFDKSEEKLDKSRKKGRRRNPFKKQTPKQEEKETTVKVDANFLGFNEDEIEEGQQSTSLRLSQSEDVEPSEIPLTSGISSKTKKMKSEATSAKQKWEKKSAKSLKNWLATPTKSGEDDVCDNVDKSSSKQKSSILPKKRHSKTNNLNVSSEPDQSVEHLEDVSSTSSAIKGDPDSDGSLEEKILRLIDIKARPKRGRPPKVRTASKVDEDSSPVESTAKGRKTKLVAKKLKTLKRGRKLEVDDTEKTSKRKQKLSTNNVQIDDDIKKEPTKSTLSSPEKGKRKHLPDTNTQTTTEPDAKRVCLDLDEKIIDLFTIKRKRGRRPKNQEQICEPPKPPAVIKTPVTPLGKKYKSDMEFNPRLLLIRKKEELKSNEPLVDPTLQTEPKGPDDVQCAVCLGYASKKKWLHHVGNHYGIGWVVGQPPPLNIKSRSSVLNFMVEFFKASKVKGLNCRLCNSLRRSALGLLMHLEQCCLTEAEINDSRVECEYCQKSYTKASYNVHKRSCPENVKLLKKTTLENTAKPETEMQDEVFSNTGRMKRQSVIKAETKLKNLEEAEFVPDDFIKHIPSKPTIESLKSHWLKEINFYGKGFCANKMCEFTATSVEDLINHYQGDVCPHHVKPGYVCVRCKFHNSEIQPVRNHVLEKHRRKQRESDAEFGSSESSDSISSGEDEDESETDKPTQKKNPNKSKRRSAKSKSQPTKDYRKLLPDRRVDIADHAADMYNQFMETNYSVDPLFTYATTNLSYIEVSESHFPKSANSMKFIHNGFSGFVKSLGQSKVEPNRWKQLERLEGFTQKFEHTFYMGGPVKCIAWVPLDPCPPSNTQYLAVAVRKEIDKFTRYINQNRSRSLIFIIKMDINLPTDNYADISYAIAIDEGPIQVLEFLPSGGYAPEMNRLGMLAVGTAETEIKIYSLPLNVKKSDCDMFPIVRLDASIELHLDLFDSPNDNTDTYRSPCTCLLWSETAGHNIIIGGFLNGYFAVWDISDDDENLNRCVLDETRRFLPVSYTWTMEDRLKHLAVHYDINGPRWLVASNAARRIMFYDLRDITQPLLFRVEVTMNVINCIEWPVIWENIMFGLGDTMPSNGSGIMISSPMSILFSNRRFDKSCTGVTDMHYNVWRNCVVTGTENGDVQVIPLKEPVLDVSNRLKVDEKTISTLDIVSLNGEEISKTAIQIPSDGKRVFDIELKNHYGLVFGCNAKFVGVKSPKYYDEKRVPPINLSRLMRVSKIRFNRNRNVCDALAVGYDNGLLRICTHDCFKQKK